MVYNDEDIDYKQAIDVLKGLPKVNAPFHFEADLMRKINSGEVKKVPAWEKIFSPLRLIPSAAAVLAAIIMVVVLNTSSVEQDDPLSIKPRVREDIHNTNSGISVDEQMRRQPVNQDEGTAAASFVSASSISKSGLNFRQINLTPEQRQKLDQLKAKITHYFQQKQQEKREK